MPRIVGTSKPSLNGRLASRSEKAPATQAAAQAGRSVNVGRIKARKVSGSAKSSPIPGGINAPRAIPRNVLNCHACELGAAFAIAGGGYDVSLVREEPGERDLPRV